MIEEFERSQLLLGRASINKMQDAKVAVFGLGGVGSFTAEALARTGVGTILLIDNDIVCKSNINRQIVALQSTVGMYKADVMKERIYDINPNTKVEVYKMFFLPGDTTIDLKSCDYVVDAIDTISAKIGLAEYCSKEGIPLISAMGCGNRLDPTKFVVTDINKTYNCPMCKVVRHELRKRRVRKLKVVFSTENTANREEFTQSDKDSRDTEAPQALNGGKRRQTPGSLGFVPSVAGLILAQQVVMGLTEGLRP